MPIYLYPFINPVTGLPDPNYPYTINTNDNSGHGYITTIVEDATGGDNIPTPSGYENTYILDIIPKDTNQGSYSINNAPYIADDLIIDGVAVTSFPSLNSPTSLHGIPTVSGNTAHQVYQISNPANHPEIEVIGIYEIYQADSGEYWNDLEPGAQPPITVNTEPVAIRLYIALETSFLNTTPTSPTSIDIDIDFASLTPIYGCTDSTAFNYNANANTDDGSCYPVITGCMDSTADNYITLTGNVQVDINTSDPSQCQFWGCIDPTALVQTGGGSYDCSGTLNGTDYSCCTYGGPDCIDPTALNYVSTSTYDCSSVLNGTDYSCCNYAVADCLHPDATNYLTNFSANNNNYYDCSVNIPPANTSSQTTSLSNTVYPTDPNWTDYSCCNFPITGCTDPTAFNYDATLEYDCNADYILDPLYTQGLPGWDACCIAFRTGCMRGMHSGLNGGLGNFPHNIYTHPGTGNSFQIDYISPDFYGTCALHQNHPPTTVSPITLNGVLGCWGLLQTPNGWGYVYENYDFYANVAGPCTIGACMDDGYCTDNPNHFDPNHPDFISTDYHLCPDSNGVSYNSPNPGVAAANFNSATQQSPVSPYAGGIQAHDDGSCVYFGCMDPISTTYVDYANADSVLTSDADFQLMITEPHIFNVPIYDPVGGVVGDCTGGYALGCTDSSASNYDPTATVDDGTCCVDGCMDDGGTTATPAGIWPTPLYPGYAADNFDPTATCHDQSVCTYTVTSGCTDPNAANYLSTAMVDDGSCTYDACLDTLSTQHDGTLAATNSGQDCSGTTYTNLNNDPLCNNIVTSGLGPPTLYQYTCEYGCPQWSGSGRYGRTNSPNASLWIKFTTKDMPWLDQSGNPVLRNFKVEFRYNIISGQPSATKYYRFLLQENNTSPGEWYLSLDFEPGSSGFSILDGPNGNPVTGVTCINPQITAGFSGNQATSHSFNDAPFIQSFSSNTVTAGMSYRVKSFIDSSTGGGHGDTYMFYHDYTHSGTFQTDYGGACNPNNGTYSGSNYILGCTDQNSSNYAPSAQIDAGNCLPPCACCDDGLSVPATESNYGTNISIDTTDPCDPLLVVEVFNNDPTCGLTGNCPMPRKVGVVVTGFTDPTTGLVDPTLQVTSEMNLPNSIFSSQGNSLLPGVGPGSDMVHIYKGLGIGGFGTITGPPFTLTYKLVGNPNAQYFPNNLGGWQGGGPGLNTFGTYIDQYVGPNSTSSNMLDNQVEANYDISDKTYQPYLDVYDICYDPGDPNVTPPVPPTGFQYVNNPNFVGDPDFNSNGDINIDLSTIPNVAPVYGVTNVNALNYDPNANCSSGGGILCTEFDNQLTDQVPGAGVLNTPSNPTSSARNVRIEIVGSSVLPSGSWGVICRMRLLKGRYTAYNGPQIPANGYNWEPYITPEKVRIASFFANQTGTPCVFTGTGNNPQVTNLLNWTPYSQGTFPFEEEVMDYIIISNSNCPNPTTPQLATAEVEFIIENYIGTTTPMPSPCVAGPYIPFTGYDLLVEIGCTDSTAINYNEDCSGNIATSATVNDGCCVPIIYGCMDSFALNYYPGANQHACTCQYVGCNIADIGPPYWADVYGYCADCNFDVCLNDDGDISTSFSVTTPSLGYTNAGTCEFVGVGNTCTSGNGYKYRNYDPAANVSALCLT